MAQMRYSVQFTSPGVVSVIRSAIPRPRADQVLVQTLVSGISAGTELLLYRGQWPAGVSLDETLPALRTTPTYPLKYGYACVGRIIEVGHDVPREWINRVVFAFNPHESHFLSHVEDLVPLPPDLPAEQATLIPTMETAVTLVMDSRPVIGENVIVLGQGAVGLTTLALLAAFPLKRLIAVDRYPRRLILSRLMGAQFTFPADDPETAHNIKALLNNEGGPGLADLVVEVSGAAEALDTAINLAGFAGRVVVGSWYGAKRVSLDLGSHFHRNRIILASSQVSTLGPSMQARWTRTRRMSVAVAQLQRVRPAGMITHSFPVEQAPEAYCLLDEHPGEALWIVLTYGESM